jgi:hypothetical protein
MKFKHCFFFAITFFSIILSVGVSAEEFYKITAKEMGFLSLDYSISEIKRTEHSSVLHIPGFHQRSAAAARWMMCVYTDLAQKRGFKYWTVVYPDPPSEDLIVGFPNSQAEDTAHTLGPEFGSKNALPVMPVQKMVLFCESIKKRQ